MSIDPKIMIPLIRKVLPTVIAQEIVGVQPMNIHPKESETWQSYLSRLGSGINGVASNNYITEEEIITNAEKWMKIRYPGNYIVEAYYNNKKMKMDLRLKFDDPKEETMWMLKWS